MAPGAAAFLATLKATIKKLAERIPITDLLLLGVGTHKLSWILAKDRVTSLLRRAADPVRGLAQQQRRQGVTTRHGLRLAAGELVICPYCISQWVASAMLATYALSPSKARFVASIFTALTTNDQLHVHYANQRA